jgi:carbonic anhydrase
LLSLRVMSETNTCKALVIHCIDYRFVDKQKSFLEESGYLKGYDLLTIPGASKNLDQIENWIELAVNLHQPQEILVIDHEDCGAYGQDNSLKTHKKYLDQARTTLCGKYPSLKVGTFISKFSGMERI